MRAFSSLTLFVLAGALLVGTGACSDDPEPGNTGGSAGSGNTGGGDTGSGGFNPGGPTCTEPTEVTCSDQVILQLNLQDDVTPGLVENAAEGAGWLSTIDATAGGAFAADPTSYTYGRFTDQGLVKVEISDEASLESMDWDIAFRRYVIRINSGNSGPSCVRATPIPGDPAYDDVTAVPETLPQFRDDAYFTEGCELINDGSGLESSPATALAGYYEYPGCVAMSDKVFIVQTAEGRLLKLTVSDYYFPDIQEQCDTTDSVPMANTGSANFRVRWAFLP